MSREHLERHQVWIYLTALVLGLLLGRAVPRLGLVSETLVWPVLALLLYATFTQLPLASVPRALGDGRFLTTALVGNARAAGAVHRLVHHLHPAGGR